MSHTTYAYPLPASESLSCQVREDEEKYDAGAPGELSKLLALTDRIIDRLHKAEAVAWLLHGAGECPDGTHQNATWLLAELIHEALDLHRLHWEILRDDYEPKKR